MPIDAFTQYEAYIYRKVSSPASAKEYCHHVARFIDYLIECGVFLSNLAPKKRELDDAVNNYPLLLSHGDLCYDETIRTVAVALGRKPTKQTAPAISSINHFLEFAVVLAQDTREYLSLTLGINFPEPALNFEALNSTRKFSDIEKRRLQQNSVLGANLRSISATRKKRTLTPEERKKNQLLGRFSPRALDFPLNKIEELLYETPNVRDRALWALCAGGGLRQHEALSLTIDNLDFENQKVYVEDPNNLRGSERYPIAEKMRWKGRSLAAVYILPFIRQIFFEAIYEWLKIRPLSDTPFVFLKIHRQGYGEPLIGASNNALNDAFKAAQKRIKIEPDYTLHSLRHFYGVFLLNYHPVSGRDEPGLSLEDVQTLMGHSNINSTRKYARTKSARLLNKLETFDRHLMQQDMESLPTIVANNYRRLADQIEGYE